MSSSILFWIRKYCLNSGICLLLYLLTKTVVKLTAVITEAQSSYRIISTIFFSRLSPYADKLLRIISVCFNAKAHLPIKSFAFIRHWRKNCCIRRQYISYPQTSRTPTILLEGSIVQYSYWVRYTPVVPFKNHWNEIYGKVFITINFQLYFRIFHREGPGKPGGTEMKWETWLSRLHWW
jgi:hypothetical protein